MRGSGTAAPTGSTESEEVISIYRTEEVEIIDVINWAPWHRGGDPNIIKDGAGTSSSGQISEIIDMIPHGRAHLLPGETLQPPLFWPSM